MWGIEYRFSRSPSPLFSGHSGRCRLPISLVSPPDQLIRSVESLDTVGFSLSWFPWSFSEALSGELQVGLRRVTGLFLRVTGFLNAHELVFLSFIMAGVYSFKNPILYYGWGIRPEFSYLLYWLEYIPSKTLFFTMAGAYDQNFPIFHNGWSIFSKIPILLLWLEYTTRIPYSFIMAGVYSQKSLFFYYGWSILPEFPILLTLLEYTLNFLLSLIMAGVYY